MNIDRYESPFTTRYGTDVIRELLSYKNQREEWRKAWVKLAQQQDMTTNIPSFSMICTEDDQEIASRIEERTHHGLTAELELFENTVPTKAKPWLHIGVTSSDIEDEADFRIYSTCLSELHNQLVGLVMYLLDLAQEQKDTVILGRTHLQPAEPTLLGYRFLWYAARLLEINFKRPSRKGFHGAVGTNANLTYWAGPGPREFSLSTSVFQTAPRQWDMGWVSELSQIASILHKMALDIRLMAMEGILSERKAVGQTGSSAMPNKSNPITAEKICGLARLFTGYYDAVWQMAANTALERTLDDSSTRRVILPEAMLNMSELLQSSIGLIRDLVVKDPKQLLLDTLDGWRSWLPSRILTSIRINKPTPYTEAYPMVEKWVKESLGYMDLLLKHNNYTGLPTKMSLESWLWLDEVKQFVNGETILLRRNTIHRQCQGTTND